MSLWDVATWAAILVLGPGAVVVFVAFLRDARRLLAGTRPPADDRPSR
jgi:hypothetical protein